MFATEVRAELLSNIEVRARGECHEWIGPLSSHTSHPIVFIDGKQWSAQDAVWSLLNGTIPRNFVVRHVCLNPMCCNIAHLYLRHRIYDEPSGGGIPEDRTFRFIRLQNGEKAVDLQGELEKQLGIDWEYQYKIATPI